MSVRSAVDYSGIPTFDETLEQVLTNGNDAGNQSIIGLNDISLNTINGSAYPPSTAPPTISDVLTVGSVATTGQSITGLNNVGCSTINNVSYPPPTPTPPTISDVLTVGSVATTGQSITGLNNVGCSTINNVSYPPPAPATPNITAVLGIGNDANNLGILNTGPLTGVTSINGSTYSPPFTYTNLPLTTPPYPMTSGAGYVLYNSGIIANGTYLLNVNVVVGSSVSLTYAQVNVQTGPTAYQVLSQGNFLFQTLVVNNYLFIADGTTINGFEITVYTQNGGGTGIPYLYANLLKIS